MEQINECLKCIELKKSLQVEKKKVSQKNRLITLLRELVRSYEAKDLNLTFTDLSRIYESSSSEVAILKQRLTLYLNENQELLQLKNEISSRNDLLEKKYREVEDEISHLRFLNKQLGDYYREKETDHDQYKERLKKLARKLLSYEPKNSEVRKILNLQKTPVDLEPKPSKNGNRKKNEESLKEMVKDNIGDDDLITMKSKLTDNLTSEDLDMSGNFECDNDTNETDNLGIEEDSDSPAPAPVLNEPSEDDTKVNTVPDTFITSRTFDDKSSSEKSCEIISNSGDDIITCEESSSSSNFVDNVDHCTFYKNVSKDKSSFEVHENKSGSSEVLPSLFEEDSCTYQDISDQNEIDASHKDSNYFLEFEDTLPNLISPLKSDEPKVLSRLEGNQTLQIDSVAQDDSVVQDESDNIVKVDSNQQVAENYVNNRHEKESTDIKNECSSNSGDQIDKKKKSAQSAFQSKYQSINNGLLFTEKPINDCHIPLNGNYTPNYQFESPHYYGCCNNNFDSRSPVTLKLYNCSNVEITIPPMMQKQNLPIITVRDKCDLDKCCVNTSNGVNEPAVASPVQCSFIPERRTSTCDVDSNNQHVPTVLTSSKPWLNRSTHNNTRSVKGPSILQGSHDKSQNHDYYFSDYLSKNNVSEGRAFRKQWFGESGSDTIKCSRLFPIKASEQFDVEHFCYRFGGLSLKYSFPEESYRSSTSYKMNSKNKYSSLFNISQPPVFHNSLKNPLSTNNKNEWIFGKNFLNGTIKQGIPHKTEIKSNNLTSNGNQENSPNKIKRNIFQKSVLDLKTEYLNRKKFTNTIKNKISGNDSVQNPFHKVGEVNEFLRTKDCFQPVSFEVNSKQNMFSKKETILESRQMMLSQSSVKQPVESKPVPNEDLNQMPFRNSSSKLLTSQWNGTNLSGASISDSVLPRPNKDCSKSIFDLDHGKDVSTGNIITNCSISKNKTKYISTSQTLSQEKAMPAPLQNPSASINSHCSKEEVADVQHSTLLHKPPIKEHLKETLPRQRSPLVQKSKSHKNSKDSVSSQSKNLSADQEGLFKKPNVVNIKGNSDLKVTENKLKSSTPFINKEVKAVLSEKPKIDSPQEVKQLSKLNTKKSSPDVKKQFNKKYFPLQNEINEEPKFSTGSILKPSIKKHVAAASKKSINISHSLVTDQEEDKKLDVELQKIFKEMEHISVPLLGPLSKTPEIFAEETPERNEVMEIEGSSLDNSRIVKSKKKCVAKEVEDKNIISSLEKSVVNKEGPSKYDTKDNETISEQKQSFTFDESRLKMFSDDDETGSLVDEAVIHTEDPVNDDVLDNKELESGINTAENKILESVKIENVTKTEDTKASSCSEYPTDKVNETKNSVPYAPLTDYKYNISEDAANNCHSKDVEPFSTSNKGIEHNSSNDIDDEPSIFLGFYINRSDEESPSNPLVTSTSEISKMECSSIFNDPSPDIFNSAPEDISSSGVCNQQNNSVAKAEDVHEENELHLEKEECSGNKRKLDENTEHVEGMCSKKQKMFSDDEYISCESDVFICALRYLSAAAVASLDRKICSLSKPDSDANLTTKIAINHIKNLIVEVLQPVDGNVYDVINCSVKKIRQINDASPTSLAKAILELIMESIDKSEAKDKPYMPSMTKTVKMCLLVAVSFIGYNRDFVMKFCEVFEQFISSFYDKSLKVAEGSQLIIFYSSFCRTYNLDDKVKYLIYDVLYTRHIKAYPMVYKTIQTWPDVFPHSATCFSKDCLLTQTIIFILLSGASSIDEKLGNVYCISNIKSYLFKYFGYKCNYIRRDELVDKIINNIAAKGGSAALVLICKCEPWEWSSTVIEKKLLPILQVPRSMDESTMCEYILTIGRIVRGLPIAKAAHIVKITLEVFEHMLQESNSTHLSEIIIEAISLLRRHNLLKCTSILMNWKPNTKQITKKTINHISSILRVKNVGYWKNVYSAHSSNIIHNTRTIRKKQKSGFSSP